MSMIQRSINYGLKLNVLDQKILQKIAEENGYDSPEWGSFYGWKKHGRRVRKGEHGVFVRWVKKYVLENGRYILMKADDTREPAFIEKGEDFLFNMAQTVPVGTW